MNNRHYQFWIIIWTHFNEIKKWIVKASCDVTLYCGKCFVIFQTLNITLEIPLSCTVLRQKQKCASETAHNVRHQWRQGHLSHLKHQICFNLFFTLRSFQIHIFFNFRRYHGGHLVSCLCLGNAVVWKMCLSWRNWQSVVIWNILDKQNFLKGRNDIWNVLVLLSGIETTHCCHHFNCTCLKHNLIPLRKDSAGVATYCQHTKLSGEIYEMIWCLSPHSADQILYHSCWVVVVEQTGRGLKKKHSSLYTFSFQLD